MIASLIGASKGFGAETILRDLTLGIEPGDRIGLIGPNGSGKSTLLNMISGELEPDEGQRHVQEGLSIGYFRQESGLMMSGSIESQLQSVFSHLYNLEQKMRLVEGEISCQTDHESEEYHRLTDQYHRLQTEFESGDGYQMQVKINTVLTGMGFSGFSREMPVSSLSGGERARLAICKLLLAEPNLLMLDEVTNHLDFHMLAWLESYLSSYKGAILAVSHDRFFLDTITRCIWEMEDKGVVAYPAGYTGYLTLKRERFERRQKEYERFQRERQRFQDYADRNMARASTSSSAKSRLKMIEHLEPVERPVMPQKPPYIKFPEATRTVKDLLVVSSLSLSVGEGEKRKTLFDDLDLTVTRGERLAIIGENGAGKTSLLKALIGRLPFQSGDVFWGGGVKICYFDQGDEGLDMDKTALEQLWDLFPQSSEHALRTLLGGLGLSGDDVYKKVGDLSGGERSRVKLAIISMTGGNVLIMDEPTNHLDIDAKEALDAALLDFSGTLILVSHDRYLLGKIPTRILEMRGGEAKSFPGAFDSYLSAIAGREQAEAAAQPQKPQGEEKQYHRSKRQRAEQLAAVRRQSELETEIARLEEDLSTCQMRMSDPEIAADYQKLSGLVEEAARLSDELEQRYAQWEISI